MYVLTYCSFVFTEALVCLGYNRQEIEYSLAEAKYDDVFATYLLLGRKSTDVSCIIIFNVIGLELIYTCAG